MTEVNIKEEKEDVDDNDDRIPELTKLLEEVEKEVEAPPARAIDSSTEITKLLIEFKREDEAPPANADADGNSLPDLTKLLEEVKHEDEPLPVVSSNTNPIPEPFIESLHKTECAEKPTESLEDADIQRLQELLIQKQKELKEAESQVSGPSNTNSLKRKAKDRQRKDKDVRKRVRNESSEQRRSRSGSPFERETASNHNEAQTQASCSNTELMPNKEDDIEKLLKAEDDYSDDDIQNVLQEVALQSSFVFPTEMPIEGEALGQNQMSNYQPIYSTGTPFFMPHMGTPMMGYGHPQVQNDENEVECLPVINSTGFLGMPTFKRIKLEKSSQVYNKEEDENKELPDERRKRILGACSKLLEKLEFPEASGKFIYTPTVTKLNTETKSNSVLQKIVNVSYEFQSIGPKVNLADWGLREIASCNADVAKKIGLSAEIYFAKIVEKANTTPRKLIKVEDATADDNQDKQEMEEPTLSTFLKNSMTQTEPLSCRECVLRKRIVSHHIGVQVTVSSGSVGSQTVSFHENSDRQSLTAGLSHKQLSALFKFSNLIREPSKNTNIDMFNLRETLLGIYNSSQAPNLEPPIYDHYAHANRVVSIDPRMDNSLNLDLRQFSHSSMRNASINHSLDVDTHMMNQRPMPHATQAHIYNPESVHFANNPVQAPNTRPRLMNPRYQPFEMPEKRKSFGRGGQMHY